MQTPGIRSGEAGQAANRVVGEGLVIPSRSLGLVQSGKAETSPSREKSNTRNDFFVLQVDSTWPFGSLMARQPSRNRLSDSMKVAFG